MQRALAEAPRADQFNPHQSRDTQGREADWGFGHWAQLFSLGAIHLSLVVALCICCVAAYVLATLGTHYIPSASSHFPSLLVSCMSIYPSTLLLHGSARSGPPLPAPILKPSICGQNYYLYCQIYICKYIHIYAHTCTDVLCKESCLSHHLPAQKYFCYQGEHTEARKS